MIDVYLFCELKQVSDAVFLEKAVDCISWMGT